MVQSGIINDDHRSRSTHHEALDKQNVAQALSVVPGVVLQKSGSRNEEQVKVRGFDSRQVPVYFDGVPIYVPYDGNLDLARILTNNLGAVEVSKGYSSLLQGPNQMGGAINITTQKPTKPLEASLGYRQGWSRSQDNAYDMHASGTISMPIPFKIRTAARWITAVWMPVLRGKSAIYWM